uniref:Reverse transcriptase Ty1/copia-type domain-containing protein n=1 Tax=Vitis vinifera TaxID=29760 RepID=A5BYL8_VITVI|nr:hypothetical protein VITISV_024044 [Vitis vinifera]
MEGNEFLVATFFVKEFPGTFKGTSAFASFSNEVTRRSISRSESHWSKSSSETLRFDLRAKGNTFGSCNIRCPKTPYCQLSPYSLLHNLIKAELGPGRTFKTNTHSNYFAYIDTRRGIVDTQATCESVPVIRRILVFWIDGSKKVTSFTLSQIQMTKYTTMDNALYYKNSAHGQSHQPSITPIWRQMYHITLLAEPLRNSTSRNKSTGFNMSSIWHHLGHENQCQSDNDQPIIGKTNPRPTILRQTLTLISQPSNALTAIRLVIPRVVALKFVGYLDWWDHNRDKRKKDSEKASALVATIDYGGLSCIVIFCPEFCVIKDIQTRQTIDCGIKRGKLYYLDLQSKDSNKLQQALMVQVLCSDNGGEYQSFNLQKHLEGHGIIHQTTCSNTPEQNGVAGWKNRHLLEVVRASLIEEYHKEIQTLDYDYHIFKEDEYEQSELVNQEAGELDMSGTTLEPNVFTEIPNQSSSAEGVLNLELDPFMKRLPHFHNRGIPKPTYEPELSIKVKYPMSNYVSSHCLFESNKSFVNQLSTVAIPNKCPPGKKPVGCRWIYTVKYKADGSIERFKARLVEKGYTQTYEIDYTETFSPVAKINTVRVLLSLAANLDWPLQQFNVENAFLHSELSEEVYMDLSPGCMQSPRAWFGRFTKLMRAFGYHQSNLNHTLFLKKQHGKIMALIVYMDDMETGMLGCQPVDTPIEEGLKLCVEPNQGSTDKGRYQRLVGRLMYLAHTRPDIAYALSVMSQYMHNPGKQYMNAVMRILSIEVYTDADWASVVDDRRSTSSYFTFVGSNLVTWKKAEFRGIALGLCEALWLRLLLQDLGYLSRQPIRLFCDNKTACDIAHNPVQHDLTKHVEVDRFFIKEKLDDKIVELPKIRSKDQLADILTKVAVSNRVFSKFLDKLGMCDIYAPT